MFGNSDLDRVRTGIRKAFARVREEFDEHRDSINQNTNEIQANYEYLCRLDAKIDKLSERIDELTLFLMPKAAKKKTYEVAELTTREKEVFLALYAADEPVRYADIARRVGLTENLVICYVSNLISKGIPVIKRYRDDVVVLSLEPQFKECQMRENIVGVSQSTGTSMAV